MPWNDLASNQAVSYIDAQTSPFSLRPGQTRVTSNQCMTRLDAITRYNVNINPLLCADNQLAPKSLWENAGNSVVFSNGNANVNTSGTVTITGASASFAASMAVAFYSGGTFSCTINIDGNVRSVSFSGTQPSSRTSSFFTLPPGIYNYSITSTVGNSPFTWGWSIAFTQ